MCRVDDEFFQGYAADIDPEFNTRHFSAAGRAMWNVPELISAMVKRYDPEYLLILLGYNDLAWYFVTLNGSEVLSTMKELVAQARAAKPNLKFAIGDVPQRMPAYGDLPNRTDDYNKLLAEAIPQWSTETSPMELVHMREYYQCENDKCPAGFDGLHPNALGEYQIAQAFSRALVKGFKLGTTELVVPAFIPPRANSIPRNFRAVAGPDGVNVTWDAVYGAKEYDVQSRLVGEQEWAIWPHIQESRFYTPWVNRKVVDMEYKVRMSNGDEKGECSPVIRTCRSWNASTDDKIWSLRWWYRKFWACS
jgi:lysophospholipase L1-like esterase